MNKTGRAGIDIGTPTYRLAAGSLGKLKIAEPTETVGPAKPTITVEVVRPVTDMDAVSITVTKAGPSTGTVWETGNSVTITTPVLVL